MKLLNGKDKRDCCNVTKLRSLHASLIEAIKPEDSRATQIQSYSIRNFRRSDHYKYDEDDDGTIQFRRVESSSKHAISTNKLWLGLSAYESSPIRKNDDVPALLQARRDESRVIELLRSIGEIVVYGEQKTKGSVESRNNNRRDRSGKNLNDHDAVFEYFCDKNIISLFVDISKAKPSCDEDLVEYDSNTRCSRGIPYSGVVWTALVKSQVYQTVSILVSNVQDPKSLYYLLSNNYINELVSSVVPLNQWKGSALTELLPVYISFLKTLAIQLASNPHLFQFYCNENNTIALPTFPLLYSAVKVASSHFCEFQADDFVHTTALSIILNICQLPSREIREVVGESLTEQCSLLSTLCEGITEQYEIISKLVIGSCVALKRHTLVKRELIKLEDTLHFVNDLCLCAVRTLNVKLCEYMLRYIVFKPLLQNMLIDNSNCLVGKCTNGQDIDPNGIVSEDEAYAQTSVFFLTQIFMTVHYQPLLKMIAVALLHPYTLSRQHFNDIADDGKDYILTPALNAIAQNQYIVSESSNNINAKNEKPVESTYDNKMVLVSPNPFRRVLISLLSAKLGLWRFIPAAMLFESILESKEIDHTLKTLKIFPDYSKVVKSRKDAKINFGSDADEEILVDSLFEEAIGEFFDNLKNSSSSKKGQLSTECALSLVICFTDHLIQSLTEGGTNFEHFSVRFLSSPLVCGIWSAKRRFAVDCQRFMDIPDVHDFFTEEVRVKYEIVRNNGKMQAIFDLRKVTAVSHKTNPDILVLSRHDTVDNEIQSVQFAIRITLHLRSICDVFQELHNNLQSAAGPASLGASSRRDTHSCKLRTICPATHDIILMGGFNESPHVGTDLNLRDKTFFFFSPSLNITGVRVKTIDMTDLVGGPIITEKDRRRKIADKILTRATSKTEMVVLIESDELFVLKPKFKNGDERGIILCSTPLRNIIATAPDGEWLHVAMRHVKDVGVLIKKGNMALRFASDVTCQEMETLLEKCQNESQKAMLLLVDKFLQECVTDDNKA